MENLEKWVLNHTPWYILLILVCVIGFIKYGPKFLKRWSDTISEIKDRDRLPFMGYITDLKLQREKLEKKNSELEEDNEELGHELDLKNKEIELLRDEVNRLRAKSRN